MAPEGRKYNMFNQGSKARPSVVVSVIIRSTGNNTSSNTPRINTPATIEIKQFEKFIFVTIIAKSVVETISIIVCIPNGSGNSLAKIARIATINDNNNALEYFIYRLNS